MLYFVLLYTYIYIYMSLNFINLITSVRLYPHNDTSDLYSSHSVTFLSCVKAHYKFISRC